LDSLGQAGLIPLPILPTRERWAEASGGLGFESLGLNFSVDKSSMVWQIDAVRNRLR
jgi:hypothetical protein